MKPLMKSIGLFLLLIGLLNSPACTTLPSATQAAATFVLLEPRDGASVAGGVPLAITGKLTGADGITRLEVLLDGQPVRVDDFGKSLGNSQLLVMYVPRQAGQHSLQLRGSGNGGQLLSQSITIIVGDIVPTSTPTFTPTLTLTPTYSPTPTITFTPSPSATPTLGVPMATARENANCRFGPSPVFETTNSFLLGASAEVIGRNAEGTWTLLRIGTFAPCWVWNDLIDISGPTAGIPLVETPPTPTPTSLPLPIPAQVSPSGAFTCRSTIVLDWNAVSGVPGGVLYQWKLVGPLGKTEGNTAETQKEVAVACGKTYTWQVRVLTALGVPGAYSAKMGFTISP